MACAILVMLSIWEQLEYDNFHPHADRLYRAYIDVKLGGLESQATLSSSLFAFELRKDIPEIEQSCRIYRLHRDVPVTKPASYILDRHTLLFVDSTFFDLFGFKLLKGNPRTCLDKKNSVILSNTLSQKLFPNGEALGKTILVDKDKTWTVTGIIEDSPKNSHIQYEALASMSSAVFPPAVWTTNFQWTTNFLTTYYRFRAGVNLDQTVDAGYKELSAMEYKLTEAFLKRASEEFRRGMGMSLQDLHQADNYYAIRLQKVENIHLFSNLKYETSLNVNFQTFLILAGISLLIILIGCINYANLSTARLAGRVREIGIRKILGSQKRELSAQLLTESITISFISLLLALVLVELIYPHVNLLQSSTRTDILPQLLKLSPLIFGVTMLTGILAGVYPAFYILKFTPATILRQQKQFSAGGKNLRGLLVIFQFIFSIIIIFSTSTIYRQLRYVQHRGVGFDKEKMIVLENALELKGKSEDFRKELLSIPGVKAVTYSSSVPGRAFQMNSYQSGEDRQKNHLMTMVETDSFFIRTYGITLEQERNDFSWKQKNDTFDTYINEAAARYLNLVNPVGKEFYEVREHNQYVCMRIKGVVKDFNTESLHSKIQPLVMIPLNTERIPYVSIRLDEPVNPKLLDQIKQKWNKFMPDIPFSEFSMEESLGSFYKEEQTTGQVALIFSFLAIFIACMGLYSLLALTTVYRTKEIGIRKVFGAGIRELITLLTREIFKLIAISGLIALPVAFLLSRFWLERFA
jgi:putative ABC transport system permease protein